MSTAIDRLVKVIADLNEYQAARLGSHPVLCTEAVIVRTKDELRVAIRSAILEVVREEQQRSHGAPIRVGHGG